MSYQLSGETKKQTVRCTHDFQCLNDNCNMCSILKCLENTLLVKGPKHLHCSYFLSYGDKLFCLCPSRHELYIRYGK